MNFKIKHIKIENFRAIEHIETDLWDKTIISGDNETGKSTFASAITWCLFGKDIENNSNFEIVPSGEYGEISPCVTIECEIDMRPVTLSRLYKACKARDGSFTEYKTITSVNGVEIGVRKFQEWITENICNEQVFKILSNPKTFVEDCPKEPKELLWQSQRRFIMSIINNNQSDEDIAKQTNKWSDLVEHFKRYGTATSYLTYLKKEYSDTQKQLDSFLIRIEQQSKNIVLVSINETDIQQKLSDIKNEYSQIKAQKEQAQSNALNQTVSDMYAKIDALREEENNLKQDYSEKLKLYESAKIAFQKDVDTINLQISDKMKTIKTYAEALDKLKSTVVVEICSTCGQKLTPNAIKNSKLNLENRIKTGQQKTEELMNAVAELNRQLESKQTTLRNLHAPTLPVRIEIIRKEIAELKKQLKGSTVEVNVSAYDSRMEELETAINGLKDEYSKIKQNKQCQEEIEKIKQEQQNCVKSISEYQRMLDLTKEFISKKCKESENKINSLFETVKFKLFESNKTNDEIKETCIVLYNGHKYQNLSTSTKIIASLEIVKAFQNHYNVTVPCIIDNCESITGELNSDGQIVMLKVVPEECPVCGYVNSSRKGVDGKWVCLNCGNRWEKKLVIDEYGFHVEE